MKRLLILLLCGLLNNYLFAQTYNYTHYSVENGLASSNVYVAFQDSKKFMWIGTEHGVNRFDGKTFETYTTENGLADNDVLRIFEDSKGRIWFLTIGGHLSYFKDGKIFNEKSNPYLLKGFTGAGIYYAFEDSKKRIWFCSYNAIVSVLENESFSQIKIEDSYPAYGACVDEDDKGDIFLFSKNKKFKYVENTKNVIAVDTMPFEIYVSYMRSPSGNIFFHTADYVYKIHKGEISKCLDLRALKIENCLTIAENSNGDLLVGSMNSANVIENNDKPSVKNNLYLKEEWVNSVNYDNEGNLWFMTKRNGIFILPKQFKENKLFHSPLLLNDNIYALAADNNGKIWIGSSKGQLAYVDKDQIHNISLGKDMTFQGNFLSLEKDLEGNIWAGTDDNLIKIDINKNKKSSDVYSITKHIKQRSLDVSFNSKNEIIVASPQYLVSVTDNGNKLIPHIRKDLYFFKRTFAAYYDFNDSLYLANIDGLQEKSGNHLINLGEKDSLLLNKIVCIQQTKDSTLLLATDGYGLIFYKNGKVTRHLTRFNGLMSDLCRKIKISNDNIYVCTKKGLTIFTYRNDSVFNFVQFNKSSGLVSNNVRDICIVKDNIYVGTSNGLSVLKSSTINFQRTTPPVYIRAVYNGRNPIDWKKPFELDYNSNDLTVHYNAITFSNQEELIFEYSLQEKPKIWNSITLTALSFPDITPGKHTFNIRAKKKDSLWSEPVSFTFTVNPPFYLSWWFNLIIIISLFGGLSLTFIFLNRKRLRARLVMLEKKNALNLERNRISADMHDDVGSDLSKIAMMAELIKIKDKNVSDVQKDLVKISDFVTSARKKLDDIIWALNPSNDSVGNMVGYINQYCLNFFDGTKIKANIKYHPAKDIQLNASQRRNIFLIIKEIANNTLKHSSATEFFLNFHTTEKEININVGDNGKGLDDNSSKEYSNGMNNILKRINELNGNVNVVNISGNGLKYEIKICYISTR
jgi:signal transduction histidine kinase/ligand-binding sensor domain-containing protein